MVTTRSGKEIGDIIKDIITSKQKSSKKNSDNKKVTNKKLKKQKKGTVILDDSSSDSESELINDDESIASEDTESTFDEEEMFEESYDLPKHLKGNTKLKKRFSALVQRIKSQEPSIEQILQLKIRSKRKVELLQQYYIYRYSTLPHSEEKYYMRKELNAYIDQAKKEYSEFCLHKKKFLTLEKHNKIENDLMLLKKKLLDLDTTQENLNILYQKFNALESRSEGGSEEHFKALNWMKQCLSLPFNKITKIKMIDNDIEKFLMYTKAQLDKELYGMTSAKEQILLYLHDRLKNPTTRQPPLALLGSPGMGKTSIALSLAQLMGLPFASLSLGGVAEPSFLTGHCSTFVGSKPGRIASSLISTQSNTSVLFFDEIDKIENNDVVSSLLHIMDTTQNALFRDNYFGQITIDLSNVFFIVSMNEKPKDRALADRLSYVTIDDYTEKEKCIITERYLLPKALKNVGLNKEDILFSNHDMIQSFVRKISPGSSGIRKLKEAMGTLISKILFNINNQSIDTSFTLNRDKYSKTNLVFPFKITEDIISHLLSDMIHKPNPGLQHLYI